MARTYPLSAPWGWMHHERLFCLTADQDWAPDWAISNMLAWVSRLELSVHVFQTNHSAVLESAAQADVVTRGWHPNFLANSSHGDGDEAIVLNMSRQMPEATTFRTHAFGESYRSLELLKAAGMRSGSQFPTAFAGHITPLLHATGIVTLPVWFEDDIWMRQFPDSESIDSLRRSIDTPGLKILNVHPVHIALNSPSFAYYDKYRSTIYETSGSLNNQPAEFGGYGVRDAVEDIIALAKSEGERIYEFPEIDQIACEMAAGDPIALPTPVP